MSTPSLSVISSGSRWLRQLFATGLLVLVSGAAFLCGRTAFGVDYTWIGGAANEWNTAANWTPAGGPPGTLPTDNAHITAVHNPILIDTAGGPLAAGGVNEVIFDDPNGGTVNQSDETLTVGAGRLLLGAVAGNPGSSYNYNLTGTGQIVANGRIYISEFGGAGSPLSTFTQGVLNDSGATSVTVNSRLSIGGGNGPVGGNGLYVLNSGVLTVNGDGIAGDIGRYTAAGGTQAVGEMDINGGTLNVDSNAPVAGQNGDFRLANNTGTTGLISQTGGAANFSTGAGTNNNLIVGNGGDGVGTYNLSGGVLTIGNSAGGSLIIANATPATAGKVTGILNISGTGDLEAPGFRVLVGNATGASATITMTNGVANLANGITLGNAAGSTTVLNVHGGSFIANNGDTLIANADGSTATVNQDGGDVELESGGNNNWAFVGSGGTGNGTYNLSNGATLNVGNNFPHGNGRLVIARTAAGGKGTFNITGTGSTLNTGNDMDVDNGGTGVFNQGPGTTVSVGQWLFLGASGNAGASGTYNMMGGTLTTERLVDGSDTSNGSQGGTGHFIQTGGSVTSHNDLSIGDHPSTADYTISGPSSGPNAVTLTTGTIVENATRGMGMLIGWGGNGTMNQNGGLVTVGQEGVGFNGGGTATASGVYNLSGGVLNTAAVYKMGTTATNGSATFNFNGGILQASAPTGNRPIFMGPGNPNLSDGTVLPGMTAANVQAGGAIFDTNGYAITVSQDLLHGTVAPLDGGLTLADSSGTTGSVNTVPGSLTLTGNNSFTGDTNVTNNTASLHGLLILGSTGALAGSTLNMTFDSGPAALAPMVQFAPGVGSFTLGGLKGAANLALPDSGGAGITLSVGNNNQNTTYTGVLSDTGGAAASGLTKVGTGTLHLTAVQAYTGPTFVSNGTLSLNGASIAGSSAVQVGGLASTGPSPTLLAQNGANAGSVTVGPIYGTFGPGDVAIANANSLIVNDGGALALTLGSSSSPNSDLIAVSGALTLPTVGVAKVNLADNAGAGGHGSIGPGTYKIITYGSLTNAFNPLSLSAGITALPGDTYTFSQTGSEIDVNVVAAKSWTGAVDGGWGTTTAPTNWVGGIIPGATAGTTNSDTADFNAGSPNTTVTVDAGRNVRSITFEAAASGYTIGGSALLLSTGGTIQNTSAVANDENVNAPLVLEGANGRYSFSSNSATNLLNMGGAITGGAAGNTILTLTGSNTGANTISGAIGNGTATTVALFKSGAGTWVLSGNNTFTGGVTIDGGTLRVGSPVAFNSSIPVTFTNITTGTLALNGISTTIGGLSGATTAGTVVNGSATSTATLTVNSATTPSSFSGLLADGGAKALNLTLSSAAGGDLTLLNANTFSGVTNVTGAGTVILGNANALQNSTLNVTVAGNSVQFPVGLTPFTLGGLSGPAGLVLQDTTAGPITLNIGNNGQNTQYDGVLSEVGAGSAITKIGAGTLSLSQAPTYTGVTTVSAGTLAFDPPAGTLTFGGVIAGTGVVAATGPGALTLTSNANTWSGGLAVSPGVTVNAGPWQTGASNPLGTGAVTLNAGSTLNLAGSAAAGVPPPFDPTQTYAASLTIAGNSTVNVTGSAAATMGTLRIGAKLSVTGDPGSSLTLGLTTLTGPATVSPAANTTLIVGAIGESPAGQSLSMTGAGTVVAGAPGSYTGGTAISSGVVNVQANTALGTGAIGMTGGILRLGAVAKQKFGLSVIGGFDAPTTAAGPLLATDAAGVVPITNWNNITTDGNNGNPNLQAGYTQVLSTNGGIPAPGAGINSPIANTVVDNNGVATAVTIAFNAQNGWSSSNLTTNANQKLMNGYLDMTQGPTGTPTRLSIGNLPAGHVWDVYAYISSDANNRVGHGSVAQDTVDGPFYVMSNDAGGFGGFIQATALTNPDAVPSNYMYFPAVVPGPSTNPFSLNAPNSIDLSWVEDVTGANLGIAGLEVVDVTPGNISASLGNALNITGNATIDVTGGSSGGVTGAVTIGSNTLFVTGGSSGANVPYALTLGATTLNGNPTFNVANNGTGLGTATLASLNDGGSVRVITKANSGTLEVDGASTLTGGAPGTAINVSAGTLRFKNTVGAATIGAGVTATVTSGATLELAGSISDLSSPTTPLTRAHVINNSKQVSGGSLLVSGTNQQVGAIDGTGDTVVNAGASLTANHIIQNALVIGGTSTSAANVTIGASDASGNPLASGLALAGSLAPSDPFGGSGTSSSLAANGSTEAGGSSLGGTSGLGGSSSAVPEPSTVLLLALGSLACFWPALRRRVTR